VGGQAAIAGWPVPLDGGQKRSNPSRGCGHTQFSLLAPLRPQFVARIKPPQAVKYGATTEPEDSGLWGLGPPVPNPSAGERLFYGLWSDFARCLAVCGCASYNCC